MSTHTLKTWLHGANANCLIKCLIVRQSCVAIVQRKKKSEGGCKNTNNKSVATATARVII